MPALDAVFKRWTISLIAIFIVVALYVIVADRFAPVTTEGRIQGQVVQLATEVSATVAAVHVANNDRVEAGQLLFSLDDRRFKLALNQAELTLQQAREQQQVLKAQIQAAQAQLARSQANFAHASKEYNRTRKMGEQQLVSQSVLDKSRTEVLATEADRDMARQQLNTLKVQLVNGSTAAVALAENALKQARLNLSYTQIRAPEAGTVSNLQLVSGSYANAHQPLLSFVPANSLWISADFREKALAAMPDDARALVAYDALPGEVFSVSVGSRDVGVAQAQQVANGTLASIQVSNRWVRDSQRVRLNLTPNRALPAQLFIGSRASIALYPQEDSLWSAVAQLQITLISLLHFIY
ncbi:MULTISPECIES: HlyD family secretion protein [Ferrimonas]|uniref:HlyD family secretion protein n=1 Tax=Ferrimonas TaxID=44011 RepID=UPI00040472DB|nr:MULTISPECIES: HlyD family secretion protein [Ferrimonas]USD39433.1 HlyD family secretion protein [Ferrimonas sp. SCSIO 43195]